MTKDELEAFIAEHAEVDLNKLNKSQILELISSAGIPIDVELTDKSTKQEIIDAYNDGLDALKDMHGISDAPPADNE